MVGLEIGYDQRFLLYGSETLNSTKKYEEKLLKRKIKRSRFGSERDDVEWRCSKNPELYDTMDQPNFVQKMKTRRLRWAEHETRLPVSLRIKTLFLGYRSKTRRQGKARKQWEDDLLKDLQRLWAYERELDPRAAESQEFEAVLRWKHNLQGPWSPVQKEVNSVGVFNYC